MKTLIETIRLLGKNTETKVIKFKDNGVPEFLARLDAFEKNSRKSMFVVGSLCAFLVIISGCLLSSCATRRYVRQQILINDCVQTIRAIDRESGILYAAAEMYAERSGPQRSEIGQRAHDLTVYDMCERLNKLEETTRKIREVAE